jgi:predicted nucleic acid-binding protein
MAVAEEFLKALPSLPVHIDVPDREGIMAAARIKASRAMAYGDSFAIALAQATDSSVITGDNEIRECNLVRSTRLAIRTARCRHTFHWRCRVLP